MERLPKHEYFQLRLTQAIEDGNTQKAEYYSRRLSDMFKGQAKFEYVPDTKTLRVYRRPNYDIIDSVG